MVNKHMYINFTKEEVDHIKSFISIHADWQDKVINRLYDIFDYIEFPKDHLLTIETHDTCNKEPMLEQKQVQRRKYES